MMDCNELERLIESVCDLYGITPERFRSASRRGDLSRPRAMVTGIALKDGWTLSGLATCSAYADRNMNHTSVMNRRDNFNYWKDYDSGFRLDMSVARINSGLEFQK